MNILDKIVLEKKNHNFYLKQKQLKFTIKKKSNFINEIKKTIRSGNNALIAEFKRFSPSVKKFKKVKNIYDVISSYDKSNCCCISILTDHHFGGSLNDLIVAKKMTKKPLIRKDFIIDKTQVLESKLYGADAILLIAKILTKKQLMDLFNYSKKLSLDVLIEVESEFELNKLKGIKPDLIGINNRNLREQRIDINKSLNLSKKLDDTLIVSESGINASNIKKIKSHSSISTFLIGGSILNTENKILYINKLFKS